jgi:ATP-dependent DNA helicase DinG
MQEQAKKELLSHFRHPVFRPGQKEAIIECVEAFDSGKRFVISELPTGVGKSDIAYTLASYYCQGNKLEEDDIDYIARNGESPFAADEFNQVYVATSQKILQDQYMRDFGDEKGYFYDIRGAANYECVSPKNQYETTCKENSKACPVRGTMGCKYHGEKIMAKTHPLTSLNNSYYYAAATRWGVRALTVFDECHNLPDNILDIVSFQVSDETLLKCTLQDHLFDESFQFKENQPNPLPTNMNLIYSWAEALIGPLERHHDFLSEAEKENGESWTKDDIDFFELIKETLSKIKVFLSSQGKTRWIGEIEFTKRGRLVRARPIDSGYFSKKVFFNQAEKFALQSATIVDPVRFAADIGLSSDEFHYIEKPSPFPAQNRPVFFMDHVVMSKKVIEDNTPKLIEMIAKIVKAYPDQKGIIHCHTYALQEKIAKALDNGRVITHNRYNKAQALEEHVSSTKPTILLSPSMTEGVDLKGELARFCIVCKLPFLFRGDQRVIEKMALDPGWENYQVAKTLVQSVGRGVRSETDWCHTYILDKAFGAFIRKTRMPSDFLRAVRSRSDAQKLFTRKGYDNLI